MTLNREHFEAWLFSQPKEKLFLYREGFPSAFHGCALCNYLRDNFKEDFGVGSDFFFLAGEEIAMPVWLVTLLDEVREPSYQAGRLRAEFTASELQTAYIKQFPNTLSDTQSLPDTKAGLLSSEQRESTQGKIDSHQTKTQK